MPETSAPSNGFSFVHRRARYDAAIYWNQTFIYLAYFSFLPIFTVWFTTQEHFSDTVAGTLFTLYIVVGSTTRTLLAPVLNGLPASLVLFCSSILAAGGVLLFMLRGNLAASVAGVVIAGTGLYINSLAAKVAISEKADTRSGQSFKGFSLLYVVMNIGAVAGPVVGVALFRRSGNELILFLALAYVVAAVLSGLVTSTSRNDIRHGEVGNSEFGRFRSYLAGLLHPLRSRRLLELLVLNFGVWFAYIQLFTVLPIVLERRHQFVDSGVLFSLSAILAIVFQLLMTGFFSARLNKHMDVTVLVAITCLVAAFAIAFLITAFVYLVFVVLIFTFGEALIMPCLDELTSRIAPRSMRSSYFGLVGVSKALGQGLGGLVGVAALSTLPISDLGKAWAVGLVSSTLVLVFFIFRRGDITKKEIDHA